MARVGGIVRRGRLLLALPLLLATGAGAQGPPPGRPDGEREARRAELRRRVEELLVTRLRETLELSEEQAATVIPAVKEMDEARHAHARSRRDALRQLADLARDPATSDDELTRRLDAMEASERAFQDSQRERHAALMQLLTPRQRVRYLPFREHFSQELRKKLREMGERSGPRRPRRHARDEEVPRGPRPKEP
jgi:hypothetical protein